MEHTEQAGPLQVDVTAHYYKPGEVVMITATISRNGAPVGGVAAEVLDPLVGEEFRAMPEPTDRLGHANYQTRLRSETSRWITVRAQGATGKVFVTRSPAGSQPGGR